MSAVRCGRAAGLAVLLLALAWSIAGCAHSSEPEQHTGYFEATIGGETYVTGSLASMDLIRSGKKLPASITTRAPQGEFVIIEDDGLGLGVCLKAEYEMRHPRMRY
jgi:hypothetical protein